MAGVKLRHQIGIDNVCWEADYPHSDSMWPGAPEQLAAAFEEAEATEDEIRKITHENAMRWFSFDPFAHVPKEEATAGALRASVRDHDVSVRARSVRGEKLSPEQTKARFDRLGQGAPGTGAQSVEN